MCIRDRLRTDPMIAGFAVFGLVLTGFFVRQLLDTRERLARSVTVPSSCLLPVTAYPTVQQLQGDSSWSA